MKYFLRTFMIFIFTYSISALGIEFSNSFISLQPPLGWSCQLENPVTICRSHNNSESKEAIMIIAAKKASPEDSLAIYKDYLSKSIENISIKNPKRFHSEIKSPPVQVQLNGSYWIDSLHYNSEIENYFTRYLATVKDDIAILVTFSVHKNFYKKYSSIFNNVLKSIVSKTQYKDREATTKNSGRMILDPRSQLQIDNPVKIEFKPIEIPLVQAPKRKLNPIIILLAVAIGALGILLLKKKK